MRGLLITEMNKVKHASFALQAKSRVQEMEQLYITNPSDLAREAWQAAQSAYQHLLSSAEKRILLQAGVL